MPSLQRASNDDVQFSGTHNCAVSRDQLEEDGKDVEVRVRCRVVDVGALDNADSPKREGDPPDVKGKLLPSVMRKVAARLVCLFKLCFNVRVVVVLVEDAPVVRSRQRAALRKLKAGMALTLPSPRTRLSNGQRWRWGRRRCT